MKSRAEGVRREYMWVGTERFRRRELASGGGLREAEQELLPGGTWAPVVASADALYGDFLAAIQILPHEVFCGLAP